MIPELVFTISGIPNKTTVHCRMTDQERLVARGKS